MYYPLPGPSGKSKSGVEPGEDGGKGSHSLGELVGRFKCAYEQHGHKLLKVYCGLPLSRDVHSTKAVKWRAQKLRIWDRPWSKARQQLDDFGEAAPVLGSDYEQLGKLPDDFHRHYEANSDEDSDGGSAAGVEKAKRQAKSAAAAGSGVQAAKSLSQGARSLGAV